MAKFRATVRVVELDGADASSVQKALEERLRQSGFERWRVLSVEAEGSPRPARENHRPIGLPRRRRSSDARGLLLVAAATWAIWFFWFISE